MAPQLPSDVQRILSFDEFPPSVRDIPASHDPLAEGVLMQHQSEWLKLCARYDLTICEKGRRTGVTYATALDSTITAATQRTAGGDNIYYIGDTKEKGLEFIGYCAHMAKVMNHAMADGWRGVEVTLFDDVQSDGSVKQITAYRIRFASSFQILALSSRPASIRGLQGIVIIDEAAFHQNVQAVLDAALALIIWGGKVRIISTHNGAKNAFNQLVQDARAGLNNFKIFFVDFNTAVANGLYERVCLIKGWEPTEEGKRAWYNDVRGAYGSNRAAMLEELDVVPRESSGVAIPGVLVKIAMREPRPVLRLACEDGFARQGTEYRKSWCEAWIEQHLAPLCAAMDADRPHCFGSDYARHRDFSVIAPMSIERDGTRRAPFLVEMNKVPTKQQEQILFHIIRALPRFIGGKMDATGSGAILAEYTADEFGAQLIDQVMLNDAWYRDHMGAFSQAFEDHTIDIPRDGDVEMDLRALETIDGITKLPAIKTKDLKDASLKRHGDSAIALALAYAASFRDMPPAAGVSNSKPNRRRPTVAGRLVRKPKPMHIGRP